MRYNWQIFNKDKLNEISPNYWIMATISNNHQKKYGKTERIKLNDTNGFPN